MLDVPQHGHNSTWLCARQLQWQLQNTGQQLVCLSAMQVDPWQRPDFAAYRCATCHAAAWEGRGSSHVESFTHMVLHIRSGIAFKRRAKGN
jgi:hypothetical protein